MKTSVYSYHYDALRFWLKKERQRQKLSLRDIAKITGQHHSIYGKLEQGGRRIDVIEFVEYCSVLKIDPKEGIDEVINSLGQKSTKILK